MILKKYFYRFGLKCQLFGIRYALISSIHINFPLISCDFKNKIVIFSSSVFDGIPRNKEQITATGGAVLGEAEQSGRLFNVKETLGKTKRTIKNGQSRECHQEWTI